MVLGQSISQACSQGISQNHSHLKAPREGSSSMLTQVHRFLLAVGHGHQFPPREPFHEGSSQHGFWLPSEGTRERTRERREPKRQKPQSFGNLLILEMISYHFGCMLFVRSEPVGLAHICNTRSWGILEGHLGSYLP